ncbi:MAG: glycoside hydrolase family 13 protein [Spirochaetia bacterium]|nr:glycoside hydrolase family 13 protein [Spirochaetia bacterium]
MQDKSWKEGVHSSVSSVYVQPLHPQKGETIRIRIQVPLSEELSDVRLVSFQLGREKQYPMQAQRSGSKLYYAAEVALHDEVMYWYFLLVADDRAYSYGLSGLKAFVVPLRECFSLKAGLVPVSWVASSTCYQVFPDRFRKGDASCGANAGEYAFDGGTVSVHAFDEKPLEFAQGRCLDFFNGDLKGVEDAIPHFKKLGVNVVYLNPIGASMTTHRYDCIDFFHIDEKLGGDEAFEQVCKALHDAGIKVVVDISINHTGTEHPWYKRAVADRSSEEASFYYFQDDGTVACWQDVPTLPQLNYRSDTLRENIYRSKESVMRSFLRPPYLQDGWRLDVSSEVGRRGEDQLCEEIWREVRRAVKQENSQAYLVGEDWVDATPFLQGDMWDATMNYLGSSRPMRSWMGETDRYMTGGWGHQPKPTRPFTGIEFAQALESHLTSMPAQMLGMQMNLINSHDTPRLYNNTELFDWGLYAGIVKLLYILPGMPSIYYGEEIALAGPYGSTERARYPMQWDEQAWNHAFFSLYTKLGALRTTYASVLADGAYTILHADEECLAFARFDEDTAMVCVLSRSAQPLTLHLPNKMLLIQSIDYVLGGEASCTSGTLQIRLEPKASSLFVGNR